MSYQSAKKKTNKSRLHDGDTKRAGHRLAIHLTLNPDISLPTQDKPFDLLREHFAANPDDLEARVAWVRPGHLLGFAWAVLSNAGTLYVVGACRCSHQARTKCVEFQVQHIALVPHNYVPVLQDVIDWQSNEGMRIRLEMAAQHMSDGHHSGEITAEFVEGETPSRAVFANVPPAILFNEDHIDFLGNDLIKKLEADGCFDEAIEGSPSNKGELLRYIDFVPVTVFTAPAEKAVGADGVATSGESVRADFARVNAEGVV